MAQPAGGVQATELFAVDASIHHYTANRNELAEEAAREAQEHPGEWVARSFDGRVTLCYSQTLDGLRSALAEKGLTLADVVLDSVESAEIDLCRPVR
ncbi:MAG: hypothetical protein JNG89_01080 [Planctomycetaceae bacterium]|nr:hypothetical protein [Planctomycetaceae bacterium]